MSWVRSIGARAFIAGMALMGLVCLATALWQWQFTDPVKFTCYLIAALLASSLKVSLPGIEGTLSVNFLFTLLGILELSLPETLAIGVASTLAQFYWRPARQIKPVQLVFNLSQVTVSSAIAYGAYQFVVARVLHAPGPLALLVAAIVHFGCNTAATSTIIGLTEEKSIAKVWGESHLWLFPYYMVGAAVAGLVHFLNSHIGWQSSLLVLPPIYLMYRSYRLYLGKLEAEKLHVEQVSKLHLRTIEALALAIEAKDETTGEHLQRVRVYAMELAKELGLSADETEALQAASVLHDIGKLAVPEHIISKPGKLTPEEFEKMKIHPIVGAEILERVRFPYPVVPIVRAHHEKWDGSGYPYGLKGEQIPIGARILSSVDFLDAMASDRQYRRALPLNDVMQKLSAESGKSFDPRVVDVLRRRYRDLEQLVAQRSESVKWSKLSTDLIVERGVAPAAGFAETGVKENQEATFLASIAAARQEAQMLFELSQDLGASLSLDETLSVFSVKLKRLVPYDSITIYVRHDDTLYPQHVSGDNFRLFESLRIPLGQGLSGWVAQNRKPIINGNPSVEPGYLNDPTKFSTLRSALALPLEGLSGVVGVLALYRAERDAFTSDNLRILLAVSGKMALAIENALKYQQAESSATTDYLTGLPNARSLFLELDRELARCKRKETSLTVMVCDMDGFKQINDRFGHLEGNRVLRMFAQALKQSCREYDYVARMGGDEFVVIAPGLEAESAVKKADQLRELARQVGQEICQEDILSLSVGRSMYPEDGLDAEELLAEADRRMYMEKQQQPSRKNRRLYPRMKGRITIECRPEGSDIPVLGNLTNISLGGCYVETSVIMAPDSRLLLNFVIDDGPLTAEGNVVRSDPGMGLAIKFKEGNRENRAHLQKILDYVDNKTRAYDSEYLTRLGRK